MRAIFAARGTSGCGAKTGSDCKLEHGESSGGFAAVDANTGATLWHFEAGTIWKASPITYTVEGRQYATIAGGANILTFSLPED